MSGIVQDRIKKYLLNRISEGQVNDLLPSQNQLKHLLGANHLTVIKVLNELEKHNYIYRIHGKGTFIKMVPHKSTRRLILVIIPKGWETLESGLFFKTLFGAFLNYSTYFDFSLKTIPFNGDIFEILNSRADGIIWLGLKTTHLNVLETLKEKQFSPLLVNRISENFDYVSLDYEYAMKTILDYYLKKGFRHFLVLGNISSNIFPDTYLRIARKILSGNASKTTLWTESYNGLQQDIIAVKEKKVIQTAFASGKKLGIIIFQHSSLLTLFEFLKQKQMKNSEQWEISMFDEFPENADIDQKRHIHEVIEPLTEIGKTVISSLNERFQGSTSQIKRLLRPKIKIKPFPPIL